MSSYTQQKQINKKKYSVLMFLYITIYIIDQELFNREGRSEGREERRKFFEINTLPPLLSKCDRNGVFYPARR